ncbi:hypothetical protein GUJ93_ZPchr0011g28615 [Zizania palustris]|uniref:Uncharacterized protein n=1 Tax=Zizania palustris TaxID=103762 RepID=A0A8J5WII7_ZIZPA|nr:hypothetical protein GUJ93_ZPchr0011g28615 [Zizania palustris]
MARSRGRRRGPRGGDSRVGGRQWRIWGGGCAGARETTGGGGGRRRRSQGRRRCVPRPREEAATGQVGRADEWARVRKGDSGSRMVPGHAGARGLGTPGS